MMSGERALAWNLGFQFEGAWFWYQPTFDSDLEKFSPGFCLLVKLIEEAADCPALSIVDLGLGAEEYKERFANQTRETLYVSLRTSVHSVREIFRYRAAQMMKMSPRLESIARTGVVRLRDLSRNGVVPALRLLARRISAFLWSKTEVLFFEWSGAAVPESRAATLEAINLNHLASAAERNCDNESFLSYLLLSASHLREKNAEGFGLFDSAGFLLGCAWATTFDGFHVPELNAKVAAPSPDSVMLFDCGGPRIAHHDGYCAQVLSLAAERIRERGKKPWVFSLASDAKAARNLERVGFQRRYSLVRRQMLGWQTIQGKTPEHIESVASEVSARV
jgi:hypothetical protein